jgi:hypothetical protein
MHRLLAALLLTLPLFAGEPLEIEDLHFFPESGWNRDDGVVQYNAFVHGRANAHELTQEIGSSGGRHQFSVTVPVYSQQATGLGDATVNYRRQLIGGDGSRLAVAPRVSLVLPTRSRSMGARSSGVQVNVPLSAALTPRLVLHSSAGATWYRERDEREINLAQSLAFAATDRLTLSVDAAWTRCLEGDGVFVVRPGVQYGFDTAAGLRIAPGLALPLGPDRREVLLYLTLERGLRSRK